MTTLVTIDGIGYTISDTWDPPPHVEYGRQTPAPGQGSLTGIDWNYVLDDSGNNVIIVTDPTNISAGQTYDCQGGAFGIGAQVQLRTITTVQYGGFPRTVIPEGEAILISGGSGFITGNMIRLNGNDPLNDGYIDPIGTAIV